jgi:NADPH:quinone reductase-like Zn-dependent oxidoreductase
MRAILSSRYGSPDALELREVEQPTPDPDRVLVRMHAASLNAMDKHMLRGTPRVMRPMMGGLRRPKDPRRGGDIAGVVEAVGADVTTVAVGDEVFGGCAGAFADYATPLAKNLVSKPANLTFDEAAAIPVAGVTALQALRDKGGLQPGQTVLINGAGGGVGTYLVQIAKALGAGEVTAVCGPGSVELARASGADRVVDYTQEDFTKAGGPYDLIVDNAGTRPLRTLRKLLTPHGTCVAVGSVELRLHRLPLPWLYDKLVPQSFRMLLASINGDDLAVLARLAEQGELRPAVERTYPLPETPEAYRHMNAGHIRGKLVIVP